MKKILALVVFSNIALLFGGCGGGKPSGAPAGEQDAPPPQPTAPGLPFAGPAAPVATPAAAAGLRTISDFADAWNTLCSMNEKAINEYDGMPILALLTPATTFISSLQFDIMNPQSKNGRFEGTMMMAGYKGFVEKAGAKLTFGYDDTLVKDGFGPFAKTGDRVVSSGSLDLEKGYYVCDTFTERAGKKIKRDYTEFKRLGDGSMIAISLNGQTLNLRGEEAPHDEAIFIHNAPGRYDFVIAKATTGPQFKAISFADKGDLTKDKASELFKTSGYAIEQTGGIRDGTLVVDK